MQAQTNEMERVAAPAPAVKPLAGLVLARITADGGAGRAVIVRDLTPLVSHKFSPAEWRTGAAEEIDRLEAMGLVASARGRYIATARGLEVAAAFLGGHVTTGAWVEVRDSLLVAKAIGIEGEPAAQLKSLLKPDGLRALIVQKAFGLPLKGKQSIPQLRAALAVVALERAFGNKLKSSLGAGLSGKMGRVLAGQLAERAVNCSTDGKLIAHLAAERAGSVQADDDALRLSLLRGLVTRALAESKIRPEPSSAGQVAARPPAIPAAANDTRPLAAPPPQPKAVRPDLPTFAAEVRDAARTKAEGWPGNRKAFISHVWQTIRVGRPDWALTEVEFKCMLAEAHRVGSIQLANADLKDKKHIDELQASAIPYKNVVWHFVRVDG